jgi:hypothetical protein
MEIAETIAPVEGRLRKHRSALTNGNRLFVLEGNADGRSASYRRFKDVLEQILADLGGPDILSEGQRQLCRRGNAFDYGRIDGMRRGRQQAVRC